MAAGNPSSSIRAIAPLQLSVSIGFSAAPVLPIFSRRRPCFDGCASPSPLFIPLPCTLLFLIRLFLTLSPPLLWPSPPPCRQLCSPPPVATETNSGFTDNRDVAAHATLILAR